MTEDFSVNEREEPAPAITDAQCLAAMREFAAQHGESFDAMWSQFDPMLCEQFISEWRAVLECAEVSGRSPAPSEEQEQHDIRVHAEGEQHQIDGICAMFGVEDWRALVELSDALKSGRSPAEVPPTRWFVIARRDRCWIPVEGSERDTQDEARAYATKLSIEDGDGGPYSICAAYRSEALAPSEPSKQAPIELAALHIDRIVGESGVAAEIDAVFSDGHTLLTAIGVEKMSALTSHRAFAVAVIVALFAGATPSERAALCADTDHPKESLILRELSK